MKRNLYNIILGIFTIVTAWTVSSCTEEDALYRSNSNNDFQIEVFLPDSKDLMTRMSYNKPSTGNGLKTSWEEGDEIKVYNSRTDQFSTYTCHLTGYSNVLWDNNGAAYEAGDKLVAIRNTQNPEPAKFVEMDFTDQDGSFGMIEKHDLMISEKATCDTTNVQFHFARQNVFMRISVDATLVDGKNNIRLELVGNKGCGLTKASLNVLDSTYNHIGDDMLKIDCIENPETIVETDTKGQTKTYYAYYVVIPGYANDNIPMDSIAVYQKDPNSQKYTHRHGKKFENGLKLRAGYIYGTRLTNITPATLLPGNEFNSKINPSNIETIKFELHSDKKSGIIVSTDNSQLPAYAVFSDDGKTVSICTPADEIQTNNDASNMFANCINLTKFVDLTLVKTNSTNNMSNMFLNCSKLKEVDTSLFYTEAVTNMSGMFKGCSTITNNDLKVSSFNTTNVTNMSSMFEGCKSVVNFTAPISKFDTGKVTNMSSMFKDCTSITFLSIALKANKLANISSMFEGCNKLMNLQFTMLGLNQNGKGSPLTNMNATFKNCTALQNIKFVGIRTPKVTTMASLFEGCSNLSTLDISMFEVTFKVTDISNLFYACSNLKTLILGDSFKFEKIKGNGAAQSSKNQNIQDAFNIDPTYSKKNKCNLQTSEDIFKIIKENADELGFDKNIFTFNGQAIQ